MQLMQQVQALTLLMPLRDQNDLAHPAYADPEAVRFRRHLLVSLALIESPPQFPLLAPAAGEANVTARSVWM